MHAAFSLVEMLMALLVASLLMVALAPVMTKKFNETVTIGGGNQFVHEVAYGSSFCPVGAEPKKYDDGTEYCEGEFTVPMGVNKIEVTLVGAGGGGAAAATAGIWEKTTSGYEDFTVPEMVNQLEATLVAGGSGGGAGGIVEKSITFVTYGKSNFTESANHKIEEISSGTGNWDVPDSVIDSGTKVSVTGCGGGGGGGANPGSYNGFGGYGFGGGSGDFITKKAVDLEGNEKVSFYIGGGGGGGGGSYATYSSGQMDGAAYGGGGGAQNGIGHLPNGGTRFAPKDYHHSHKDYGLTPGLPLTDLAGKGGIGFTHTSYSITFTTSGTNGGEQGGGKGDVSHFSGCHIGGAGGGGAATQIFTSEKTYFNASGGGGGSSPLRPTIDVVRPVVASDDCPNNAYAGGGGGGGIGGGDGGAASAGYGGGDNGVDGNGQTGGRIASSTNIFGGNYCNGGNGGSQEYDEVNSKFINYVYSKRGKSGALKITYLDYGPGGSGGGSGHIVPVQPVGVVAGEKLTVKVGERSANGAPGKILDNGTVDDAKEGGNIGYNGHSRLSRGSKIVLITQPTANYGGNLGWPGIPGGAVGCNEYYSMAGMMSNGINTAEDGRTSIAVQGFTSYSGRSASDDSYWGCKTFSNGSPGGRGGYTVLFGKTSHCEFGRGGKTTYTEGGVIKEAPLDGGDATGYGGCAGGGGYGLHQGGSGTVGYARISWNKTYKKGSEEEYEYSNGGSGGGGSAGNVFRYSIRVQAGDVLKYKIGKGGTGGGWSLVEGVLTQVEPTNGGMTELTTANNETLRAGGGLGGAFPLLNAITVDNRVDMNYNKDNMTYGLGGAAPNLCEFVNSKGETESFIDKEKLCVNKAGANGNEAGGGKGADAGFGAGTGGAAGATGGKVAANGSPAVGFGAGGGGAGLADLGIVNAADAVANPTVGGNGGDGKIIFRWK